MKDSDTKSQNHKWDAALEAAILNLLGEVGRADLDGMLHVLQRENIHIDHDGLSHALGRLAKKGRITVELGPDHKPIAQIHSPFLGWT